MICSPIPYYPKKSGRNAADGKRGSLGRLTVRQRPGVPHQGLLVAGNAVFPCALGRSGISALKREGDGATPLGPMRILSCYFRADRFFPGAARLPIVPIGKDLGWCEVPGDRNYNRPVTIPYGASHEFMRREDGLYDVCIVLDWNIMPRRIGRGSAIFFHLARPGFTPTQGCVALSRQVMARLLPRLSTRTVLRVVR